MWVLVARSDDKDTLRKQVSQATTRLTDVNRRTKSIGNAMTLVGGACERISDTDCVVICSGE